MIDILVNFSEIYIKIHSRAYTYFLQNVILLVKNSQNEAKKGNFERLKIIKEEVLGKNKVFFLTEEGVI